MYLPNLRRRHELAGLTQAELAARAGLTRVNVGNLERGQATRPGTARRLAAALDVAIADLAESPHPEAQRAVELMAPPAAVGQERER